MTQLTILTSVPRTEQHSIVSDQWSRLEDRADMGLLTLVSEYGACHRGGRAPMSIQSSSCSCT